MHLYFTLRSDVILQEPLSEPVHPLSPDILKELVEQGRQELNLVETESDTFNDL